MILLRAAQALRFLYMTLRKDDESLKKKGTNYEKRTVFIGIAVFCR